MPPVDALALQYAEEALDRGIVRGAADRAPAADQVLAGQEALVFVAGELTTSIRVDPTEPAPLRPAVQRLNARYRNASPRF